MILRIIDCRNFTDKSSAHTEIKKSMHFPAYYGNNLDALWDMLTEITKDTTIIFVFSSYINKDIAPVLELFREAEEENTNLKIIIS